MKIEVHLLTHDDEQMIEWSVRHYQQFADKIVIHDGGPLGLDREGPKAFRALDPGVSSGQQRIYIEPWDTAGELNDQLARDLKNSCWQGTDADVVIVVDADELIWAPDLRAVLEAKLRGGAAILRPHGFEMFSETFPSPEFFDPRTQITDLVKDGSPDDRWYAKPVVFSPKVVLDSGFGIGAHESDPVLRGGRRFHVGRDWPCCEGLALLHFKSIFGGLERIAARYDATRSRLALCNVRHGWGNFKPGIEHAQEKRDLLLPGVRRVVA